jgi:uncharacterized membrane protein (UPF0127 family)
MDWRKVFLVTTSSLVISCFGKSEEAGMKFEKAKLKLADKTITVELAKTPSQQQQGLMFRKSLPKDTGMLFIFSDEDYRAFWMRNTWIDLSIGYFDKNRILKEVIDMKATTELELNPPTYPSQHKAQYALEMTKGWFEKNKIKIGDKFELN